MSLSREWFYSTMTGDAGIAAVINGRFFQGASMRSAPTTYPFGVYSYGNSSPDNGYRSAERQYLTVFWHDIGHPGVYDTIDELVKLSRGLLENIGPVPAENILEVRYLETSSDLNDPEMGTILRYVRFQIIYSERTVG